MNQLWYFVLIPACAGTAAFFVRNDTVRRSLWALVAAVHFALSVHAVISGVPASIEGWIGIDALTMIFLPLTSLVFTGVTWYGINYMARERIAPVSESDDDSELFFINIPEAVFTGCLLLFLASMSFAILSRHFALQWIAIEASTLTSTPLIYFHRQRRSLEAAWKYLIICSVAIALALLGIFFLDVSLPRTVEDFTVDMLVKHAGMLNIQWLEIAFIFIIVGYGTKMGLVPMHNWLPDAYSEAPSTVSALLSGALLNCSFIGILRLYQVCAAAGIGSFAGDLLLVFGLMSLGLAGVFILRSLDFKRMLAYSSVEHIGILAVGIGLGGTGIYGSLFHAVNHSLVKTALFLTGGSIVAAFHTRKIGEISGLFRYWPATGLAWITGFLAITGSPPFGTFLSEFTILKTALGQGRWFVSAAYLLFLTMAFVGMLKPFLQMTFGTSGRPRTREPISCYMPQIALLMLSLYLGLHIPDYLMELLRDAAVTLGGTGI